MEPRITGDRREDQLLARIDEVGVGRIDQASAVGVRVAAAAVEALVVDMVLDHLDVPVVAGEVGLARRPVKARVDALGDIEARMAELADMFAGDQIRRMEWGSRHATAWNAVYGRRKQR